MYAVIETGGKQYRVEANDTIYVEKLEANEGEVVTLDKVLVLGGESLKVGAPYVEGAKVTAKVLSHLKGDKVIIFKKKRRKTFERKNGHRQYLTQIQIESINA